MDDIPQALDWFNRCQFHDVIRLVDESCSSSEEKIDLMFLKANCLLELGKQHESTSLMQTLDDQLGSGDCDIQTYHRGRLHYLRGEYNRALKYLAVTSKAERFEIRFKSLLCIGNCHYSQNQKRKTYGVIEQLATMLDEVQPLEYLYFRILCGNASLVFKKNPDEARRLFYEVLERSFVHEWYYLVIHAYYGIAKVCEFEAKLSELQTVTKTAICLSENLECVRLMQQFKTQFEKIINPIMEIDGFQQRIYTGRHWIDLSGKPNVFGLLRLLSGIDKTANKEAIAQTIWEGEAYHPGKHDARIYDLIVRTRRLLRRHFDHWHISWTSQGYQLQYRRNSGKGGDHEVEGVY